MILPLLATLVCSGPTTNYNARVALQPGNTVVQIKLENQKEQVEVTLAGTDSFGDCLAGNGFELCISPDMTEASLWMAFDKPEGTQVETGNLDCSKE